jgi:hypothetical protein
MACGVMEGLRGVSRGAGRVVALRQVCAAMCAGCPKAARDGNGEASGCGLWGVGIRELLSTENVVRSAVAGAGSREVCGLGRWPGMEGEVVWGWWVHRLLHWVGLGEHERGEARYRGALWFGAPEPVRWGLGLRMGREPRVGGCGCVVAWKSGRWGRWLSPWMEASPAARRWVLGVAMPAVRECVHECRAWMAQGASLSKRVRGRDQCCAGQCTRL